MSKTASATDKPAMKVKPPEVHSNPALISGWTNIARNKTKGWWIDSDDSVQTNWRLDLDKAPITVEKFDTVADLISKGTDPKTYLRGETYVLVVNLEGKDHAILFDENQNDILVFSDRQIDQLNWSNYAKDGLKYVIQVLGSNCVLRTVLRRPTFKVLHDAGVLDLIIKQYGERKNISINLAGD